MSGRKFTIILSLITLCTSAQSSWNRKNDFPGRARTASVSFSLGAFGYLGTGTDTSELLLKDFWQYDPASDSWLQLNDFPGNARKNATAFASENFGYITTGQDSSGLMKDIWEYDPVSLSWAQGQNIGDFQTFYSPGRRDASACYLNGKGYVICGYDGNTNYLKQNLEFDPVADTSWSKKANWANLNDVAVAGRRWGVCFALNNRVYYSTGWSPSQDYTKDLWAFDPSSNAWTQMASFGGDERANAFCFVLNNRAYVGGGTNNLLQRDMWMYSSESNEWTVSDSFPGIATVNSNVFVLNGHGYVCCGNDSSAALYSEVWEYVPDTTVGIPTVNPQNELKLFASEISNKFFIKGLNEKNIILDIYSAEGKLVFQKELTIDILSLENIKSGIYYYCFSKKNKIISSGKIIRL